MLTPEQLDNWFTYHPPTDETRPKYELIRAAEANAQQVVGQIDDAYKKDPTHDEVNAALRTFAEAIDATAPDSADKTAAIRCVRIARNALNEALVNIKQGKDFFELAKMARHELLKARWQANSAIACGGK